MFLHTCAKSQPTAIPASHVTAKYVPKQICPHIEFVCQIFDGIMHKMFTHT